MQRDTRETWSLPRLYPLQPQFRRLSLEAGAALAAGGAATLMLAHALATPLALPATAVPQTLVVYALVALAVVWNLPRHLPQQRFGPANTVTLARAVLACQLAGLVGLTAPALPGWTAAGLATLVLLLDGLDGWLARRFRCSSEFGARFDMECDSLFLLTLALLVATSGKVEAWVLAVGLLRYLFVAASWRLPWLTASLPPGRWRKLVFVVATALLIACLAPPVDGALARILAGGALGLLCLSFLLDVVYLWRHRFGDLR